MSDKLSIREFIDTELHSIWKEYHNYYIDCKVNLKKELFTNDIGIDGYEIIREVVNEVINEYPSQVYNGTDTEIAEGSIPQERIEAEKIENMRSLIKENIVEDVGVTALVDEDLSLQEEETVTDVVNSEPAVVDDEVIIEPAVVNDEVIIEPAVVDDEVIIEPAVVDDGDVENIIQEPNEEEEIKDYFIYNILHDNDDYVIVRSYNNSQLLSVILENKEQYPDGIDFNSIEYNFIEWHNSGSKYLNEVYEYVWYTLEY